MLSAKSISENSYLITSKSQEPKGILIVNENCMLLTIEGKKIFPTIEDVEKHFNDTIKIKNISNSKPKIDKSMFYIDEYPVKHGSDVSDIIKNNNYITYKVRKTSNVCYVAGWWILEYPSGAISYLNPKLNTLSAYNHKGPYKTEFDCNAELNIIKKNGEK